MNETFHALTKRRWTRTVTGLCLFVLASGPSLAAGEETDSSAFEHLAVYFEQNATDGDVEVVFKVKGGDDGLAKLTVVSPDGRTVIDFTAPDPTTLGIRQFEFESPEPPDVVGLKAAYPEGVYRFAGVTAAGHELHGTSSLSHRLPATVSFVQPRPDASGVDIAGLEIRWTPVSNASSYIVEIENDEVPMTLETQLPGSVSSLHVPDGLLTSGTEYELGIGTVLEDGNVSFVETRFTTAQ